MRFKPASRGGEWGEARVAGALAAVSFATYVQGLRMLELSGERFGKPLDLGRCVSVWREGSILAGNITETFMAHLVRVADGRGDNRLAPFLAMAMTGRDDLCALQSEALNQGIPTPVLAAALAYLDGFTERPLSTRLIQLQRDIFGGHGFRLKNGSVERGAW